MNCTLLGEIGKPRQLGKVVGSRGMGKLSEEARPVIGHSSLEGNLMYYRVGQRFRVGGPYWVPRLAAILLLWSSPVLAQGDTRENPCDEGRSICARWEHVGCFAIEMEGENISPPAKGEERYIWKVFSGICNPTCHFWVGYGPVYTHQFGSPGDYKVEMIYYDSANLAGSLKIHNFKVHVKAKPTANFERPVQDEGTLAVTFTADDPGAGGQYEYEWSFDVNDPLMPGVVTEDSVVTHEYDVAGSYTVRLDVTELYNSSLTDEPYECTNSVTKTIGVVWPESENPNEVPLDPTAQFTWSPQNPRLGEPITFTPIGVNAAWAEDYYFYWQFDSPSAPRSGIAPTLTRTPAQEGPFNISLALLDKRTWRTIAGPVAKTIEIGVGLRNVSIFNAPAGVDPGISTWGLEIDESTRTAWTGARDYVIGVDISNPQSLREVARLPVVSNVDSIALLDGVLVASNRYNVWLFEVSNPANPRHLAGPFSLGLVQVQDLGLFGNYLYLTSGQQIYIYDISKQRSGVAAPVGSPTSIVSIPPASGHFSSNLSFLHFGTIGGKTVGVLGQRGVNSGIPSGFRVLDMEDPTDPVVMKFVQTEGIPMEFALQDRGDRGLLCVVQHFWGNRNSGQGGVNCYEAVPNVGLEPFVLTEVASRGTAPGQQAIYGTRSLVLAGDRMFLADGGVIELNVSNTLTNGGLYKVGETTVPAGHWIIRHAPFGSGQYVITKHHNGRGSLLAVFAY
jgi:hypothetical protein